MRAGEDFYVPENPKLATFFLPIICLVAATIFSKWICRRVLYYLRLHFHLLRRHRNYEPEEHMDLFIKGIKNMLFPLFMVVLAYFFASACDQIAFIDFVIDVGMRFMSPAMLPLVIFITSALQSLRVSVGVCMSSLCLSLSPLPQRWEQIRSSRWEPFVLQVFGAAIFASTRMPQFLHPLPADAITSVTPLRSCLMERWE